MNRTMAILVLARITVALIPIGASPVKVLSNEHPQTEIVPAGVWTLPTNDAGNCYAAQAVLTYIKNGRVNLDEVKQYPDRVLWVSDSLIVVFVRNKYGYCDVHGKVQIEPRFERAETFACGRGLVRVSGKYGYVDNLGRMKIKPQFDKAWSFKNGLGCVAVGDRWGIINVDGEWIKKPLYLRLDALPDGVFATAVDGSRGFVDMNGNIKDD